MQAALHDIDALSPAQIGTWNRLLTVSPARSPFLSHAFCRAVDEVRGGVRVLEINSDDAGAGFLPFQIRRGRAWLRHGEQVGGPLADHFGIVGNITTSLDSQWLLDAANLSALRFDRAVRELCPFAFQDAEEVNCVLVEVADFDRFMASRTLADKDFVKTVGRAARRLAREVGPIRFELHSTDPERELARLIAAKREQYRRTAAGDSLSVAWRRDVLFRLLREPEDSLCRVVLSSLHCEGKWIASNFGLLCNDTLHICFPVFAPEFRRYGPGHILFFRMIEHGVAQGIRRFDFGPGEATYKLKYDGQVYSRWKGSLHGRSPAGYSERALQKCEWRVNRLLAVWRTARLGRAADAQERT